MPSPIVQQVSTDSIVSRPQVREHAGLSDEAIAGLARSIQEVGGILVPLLLRRELESLIVWDGERHLRAARLLKLPTVPAIVEEAELSDADVVHKQLVLDAQRVELSPVERARAIQRLMAETAWPAATVAVKLGVSPAHVSKLLTLLVLPSEVQEQVSAARIAMSTAYGLAKIPDAAVRQKLIDAAMDGRLTRDALANATKALVTTRRVAKPRAPRAQRERVVIPLGEGRSIVVSAPSLTVEGVAGWLAELAERLGCLRADGRAFADVVKEFSGKAGQERA